MRITAQASRSEYRRLGDQIARAAAHRLAQLIKRNIRKTFNTTGDFPEGVRVYSDGEDYVVHIDKIYATVHEFGATIRAKNKPYLVFKYKGRWCKKKEVTIPANPYIFPAITELSSSVELIG